MQMDIPIFRQINRALKLPPRAIQVWYAAIEKLDLVEEREMKLYLLAEDLEIDTSTVSRALDVLVEKGFLYRFEPVSGAHPLYRVPFSRRNIDERAASVDVAQVTTAQQPTESAPVRRARSRMISRGVL